jgi:RND family efflux transporter MFP subunit
MNKRRSGVLIVAVALSAAACGGGGEDAESAALAAPADEVLYEVTLAPRAVSQSATGVAAPVAEATLSTRLMGTIMAVHVHEGDRVREGQPLLRIDARDLAAKESQVAAGRAEAEAVLREAELHAERMRALYADDAAPKAQLDAAETGLARARAAVQAAGAGAAELAAVRAYSVVAAPFAGTIVRRMVDPGSFASPGMPLLVIQDATRLRVSANVSPSAVRQLARGATIAAVIEGQLASAVVEGVVPAPGSSLYSVNAIVDNRDGLYIPGGAATLAIPGAARPAMVVPASAVVHRGSLTGVNIRTETGTELRWIRLGPVLGDSVEVSAGLREGERVIVPVAVTNTAGR